MLAKGEVRTIIGYRRGTRARLPNAFITTPEQADELVWDPTCFHNCPCIWYMTQVLAHLAKIRCAGRHSRQGCDARSIVVLLARALLQA